MKDLRHHRSKLQKKVFREAKKHASIDSDSEKSVDSKEKAKGIREPEEFHQYKKAVPIIRTHKKRFH